MANDVSIREDDEVTTAAKPWETVSFPQAPTGRPTITVVDDYGRETVREMTDYEFRKWEESKADTAMRKEAAAAQAGTGTLTEQLRARPRVAMVPDQNQVYSFVQSASLHEARVFALAPDEHDEVRPYLADASGFLQKTRETLMKIDTAYRDMMLDKSIPPDQRTLKLQDATNAAFQKAVVGRAKAIEALQKKIAFTDGELSKPLETQAATPRSTELRAVLRSLNSPAKVNESIRAALTSEQRTPQQAELLASTLGAHALTVGISEIEQAMHVRIFNEKSAPQILRRLDLLKKALTIVEGIHPDTLHSQYEGAMRSKFSRASAISGLASKAAQSLAAINGTN